MDDNKKEHLDDITSYRLRITQCLIVNTFI